MSFDTKFKIGDKVCTFYDWHGTVKQLNFYQGELSSVTVKWFNGQVMTHPCTAEDIWLEGQQAKQSPEAKRNQRFFERQDEIHTQNTALLNDYKMAIQNAVAEGVNIEWAPEPIKNATLEGFASELERWAVLVRYLDGSQKDNDIDHDLYTRESVHGLLGGLKRQGVIVPVELLQKLAQADQYFMVNSVIVEPPNIELLKKLTQSSEPIVLQNPDAFWYEYRWPKIKSLD